MMKKKRGITLIEILLSSALLVMVVGLMTTLMFGLNSKYRESSIRKELVDISERGRFLLNDKVKSIYEVISVSDENNEIRFKFYDYEMNSKEGKIFIEDSDNGSILYFKDVSSIDTPKEKILDNLIEISMTFFDGRNKITSKLEKIRGIKFEFKIGISSRGKIRSKSDEIIISFRNR